MSQISIYDSSGYPLRTMFQWDTNQYIIVRGAEVPPYPVFHFANECSEVALVVVPEETGGTDLTVKVPNILLQQAKPIVAYMYYETDEDSYRTKHMIHIPVRQRPKPDDYEYEDNIDYVSVAAISTRLSEIIHLMTDESTSELAPEVIDIRTGPDGTVYQTAGDAVRAQVSGVTAAVDNAVTTMYRAPGYATSGTPFVLQGGGVHPVTGNNQTSTDLCRAGYTGIGTPLLVTVDTSEYQWCVWVYSNKSVDSQYKRSLTNQVYTTGPVVIPAGENDKYFRIGFKRLDGTEVTEEMRVALVEKIHLWALTDTALTTPGAAADAKAVGDRLDVVEDDVATLETWTAALDTTVETVETKCGSYMRRDPYRLIQWLKNSGSTSTGQISSLTVVDDKLFTFKYATNNADTVGNKIYSFNADGTVTATGDTFTSNIGHTNSVDWSPLTNYLVAPRVTMTGDSEQLYCLYLLPNITKDTRAFDRTAPGVVQIDIDTTLTVDGNRVFGEYRLNACWGPDDLGKGDMLYVVSDDSSSTVSGTRRLALLQLGKGSNVLAYGTAISGAASDAFNGTFNVVSAWTRPWEAVNGISEGNNDMTCWGGRIYELPAPTSTAGFPLMIHSFEDFGTTWKTERILIPYRNSSGTASSHEKEGIAIYGGRIYMGSHSAGLYVLEYN